MKMHVEHYFIDADEGVVSISLQNVDPMITYLLKEAETRNELSEHIHMALMNWAAEQIGIGKYVPFHHTSGFTTLEISLDEARKSVLETARILGMAEDRE